ncbi:hypothetical protein BDZ97DRAFT_57170 [Flammula alnicola]|nr:hypothetical protein BDZ97DRAFT_57170 [Flammula alnicola]
MVDHLRSNTAQLAGLFVEAIVYGIYLTTFGHCLYVLLRKSSGWKRPRDISFGFLFVAVSLFSVGTINLSLGLFRIIDMENDEGAKSSGFSGQGWISIVKLLTMNLQTVIADGALIGRCWHVYARKWAVILFPLALWTAGFVIMIYAVWTENQFLFHHDDSRMLSIECTIFWVVTIVLNIYTTGMIVFRIWSVDHAARSVHAADSVSSCPQSGKMKRRSKLQSVLRIVIDSGLIYTMTSFAVFCSQIASSNSVFITTGADIMVIGIAFNLIHIRVAHTRDRDELSPADSEPSTLSTIQFSHSNVFPTRNTDSVPPRSHSPPLPPLIEKNGEGEIYRSEETV